MTPNGSTASRTILLRSAVPRGGWWRGATTAIAGAALAVAVTFSAAMAQAPDTPVSIGRISSLAAAQTGTYWTEERMRNARPMPVPERTASQVTGLMSAAPAPGRLPTVAASGAPGEAPEELVGDEVDRLLQGPTPQFAAAPFAYTRYRLFPDLLATYKAFPYRPIGKLFFTIPGQGDFVCSGRA